MRVDVYLELRVARSTLLVWRMGLLVCTAMCGVGAAALVGASSRNLLLSHSIHHTVHRNSHYNPDLFGSLEAQSSFQTALIERRAVTWSR